MKIAGLYLSCVCTIFSIAGCTSIPPLVLNGEPGADAPTGPKVASLIANLKCELWDAAHSEKVLPYYWNDPAAVANPSVFPARNKPNVEKDRAFTLKNLFEEIEYVGDATWTLDVTGSSALNPALNFPEYFSKAMGLFPATGEVLSVNGQLSEAAHRNVVVYSSIDFSRLIDSPPYPYAKNIKPLTPTAHPPTPGSCNQGPELAGTLGLKETLASGLIAAAMNDITVFPSAGRASSDKSPVGEIPAYYSFGQITSQIDFTVVENVNGGPTWTLRHFKGPGGSGSGFLNFNRQVKDSIAMTFFPVCIRQKYVTWSANSPYQYFPKMVEGTPAWANYLPPCDTASHMQDKINALQKAKINNDQILLLNALKQ